MADHGAHENKNELEQASRLRFLLMGLSKEVHYKRGQILRKKEAVQVPCLMLVRVQTVQGRIATKRIPKGTAWRCLMGRKARRKTSSERSMKRRARQTVIACPRSCQASSHVGLQRVSMGKKKKQKPDEEDAGSSDSSEGGGATQANGGPQELCCAHAWINHGMHLTCLVCL